MGLTAIKLHPALGAEVHGGNFARPPRTATMVELEGLWREHHVLLFRDADIPDEAQIRFSRAFGELEVFPEPDQRSSRDPEIFRVANTEKTGRIHSADDPVDVDVDLKPGSHATLSCTRAFP
jgi:taurine dioxygenase